MGRRGAEWLVVLALVVGSVGVPASGEPASGVELSRVELSGVEMSRSSAGTATWGVVYEAAASDGYDVDRLYLAYFLRGPDAAGLAYWNERYSAGVSLAAISDAFAGSEEFRGRYGAVSDQEFVTLVYRNVLSRTPDEGGYAYWLERMAAGMSRGALMIGFSDSEEFRTVFRRSLGSDRTPAAAPDRYAFGLRRKDGSPYTWAPCETIGVVANLTGAPAGAERAIVGALAQISDAMKITWRYEGTTDERAPSAHYLDRPHEDPARYGDRYSPVLVSWPSDWSGGGSSIGYGAFAAAWQEGQIPYAVTGTVTLNPAWKPDSHAELVAVLLHELGHVANLDHVPHADELMYPTHTGLTSYQEGDLAGLARLGAWTADCPTDGG